MAVVTIVVIVIVAILAVLIALSLRLFSVERVDAKPDSPFDLPDAGGEDDQEDDEGESGSKKGEMVNVFDYFNEDGEENKDGEAQDADSDDSDSGSSASSTSSTDAVGSGNQTDKLTELKSGRGFLVDCKNILEPAKEEGLIFCACYFDYDRFSYINSLKGALTGDYVLTHTALHAKRIFPDGAAITRISADHFVALFPLVDVSLFTEYYGQLNNMCEKIRADTGVKSGMRVCVGFACTEDDSCYDINVLIARANIARHCAKVTKAEKFEVYNDSMISSGFYGDTIMESYGECQYDDEIALYFEKVLDISADKIIGCDTLSRWMYDDKNAVANNNPITTDNGHIPTNNDKAIYQTCRAMSRWRKAAREQVLVFVDLPVTDFFKTDIDDFFGKCLTEFQIDPQTLAAKIDVAIVRLDLTESARQIKKIRDIGMKVCICGVDTGYSNFDFMSSCSVDYVKLHKSFVHNIDRDSDQLEKCRRIIEKITKIGAKPIFEGVNHTEQVQSLRGANAKLVQGRYTGKIANSDELTRDLPEHIERRNNDVTVVLDDAQLAKGDFKLY